MKTNTFKTLLGTLAIAGALAAVPMSAFAADATSTGAVRINSNGSVRVVNAEVTSVTGNLISAITHFKDTLASWVFTTNASTTFRLGAGATTTPAGIPTGISVGDKISVSGALTSFGSTLGVTAAKVLDLTTRAFARGTTGTVQSINATTSTFVLLANGKNVTVQTSASTTWATGATTTGSLANVTVGAKVKVLGTFNADKTVLTASKVTINPGNVKKEDKNDDKSNKTGNKENEDKNDDNGNRGNSGKNNGLNLNAKVHIEAGDDNGGR